MKTHNLIQGSQEWLAYRAQHFNASDAPAMMGCSPYKTRAQLLRELHTGVAADVDVATQKRFDNGHRVEALARPLAEEFIGRELYPVTGSLGKLSASFDGLTLDESEGFEHKALNDALRAAFTAMDLHEHGEAHRLLPVYHRVQMEQQLHVSGADRILFMASAWDAEGNLTEERHCWYCPDEELRADILRGWVQFEADLKAYVPQPRAEEVVADTLETLPALSVRMDGALAVKSNLPAFGVALRAFVEKIPKAPKTDNEFATVDRACKALKLAEEELQRSESSALASMSDVEAMRRMVADFRNLARDTRLASEKMVERRKVEIKEQAVTKARQALDLHIAVVNAEIAPMRLQPIVADFAGAIKGLKSFDSMQDRLDTTLAAAKITADTQGRAIRANVAVFHAATIQDPSLRALFADLSTLVHKPGDDFALLVGSRIKAHHEAEAAKEAKRQADEAARIAQAEQRAREQEAARIASDQRQAEAKRIQEENDHAAALRASLVPAAELTSTARAAERVGALIAGHVAQAAVMHPHAVAPQAPAPRADEPATLNLGAICSRLGFTVSAAFLADVLHVQAAKQDKAARLYTETQFGVICRQIVAHVSAVAELCMGETA